MEKKIFSRLKQSQNCLHWQGPPEIIWSKPPAQAMSPRVLSPGPCPVKCLPKAFAIARENGRGMGM